MACASSATETQYETVLSTNIVTTTSLSVQTIPGSVTVVDTQTCLSTVSGSCAATTDVSLPTTLPDTFSTIPVPIIVTTIITESRPTMTLFASCSASQSASSSSFSTASAESSVSSASQSDTASTSAVTATATASPSSSSAPATSSSASASSTVTSFFIDHDAFAGSLVYSTITSSSPASAADIASSESAQPSMHTQQQDKSGSSNNLAPIVGGVLGGFFGLIALVALLWCIIRRKRMHDTWDDADDEVIPYPVSRTRNRQRGTDLNGHPKPYEYGLVGHANSIGTSASPPPTPAATSLGHNSRPSTFYRPDSMTPLILPASYLASDTSHSTPTEFGQRQRRSSRADEMESSGGGHGDAQQRPMSARTTPDRRSQLTLNNLSSGNSSSMPSTDYFGPIAIGESLIPPVNQLLNLNQDLPQQRSLSAASTVPSVYSNTTAPLSSGPRTASVSSHSLQVSMPVAAAVPSASQAAPPQRPHKSSKRWRISNLGSVLVHTDGGRAPRNSDAVAGTSSSLGVEPTSDVNAEEPPPPAYTE
ncbi:hypothetical protein EW146_g571 [Bondarzewia mesenterica]|uniref:Mid2 domain-containing protein n=1 Tax=Bondarzewia mesenterica TaxID=1095465 RepID=A0A4S4M8H5_9AGAM|nr:hypothetical protein EW146_g571 [Bondarzewia mesenterica]